MLAQTPPYNYLLTQKQNFLNQMNRKDYHIVFLVQILQQRIQLLFIYVTVSILKE